MRFANAIKTAKGNAHLCGILSDGGVHSHVDHMIELGKRGDLHARRQALAWMYDKQLVHSLFEAAQDRYGEQNGGYTRVLRTVSRQGDNAKMAIIELV